MDTAQIKIECDEEDIQVRVGGDVFREEVFCEFPVKTSKARLIGEIMAMRSRDLLNSSLEDLMATKLELLRNGGRLS